MKTEYILICIGIVVTVISFILRNQNVRLTSKGMTRSFLGTFIAGLYIEIFLIITTVIGIGMFIIPLILLIIHGG